MRGFALLAVILSVVVQRVVDRLDLRLEIYLLLLQLLVVADELVMLRSDVIRIADGAPRFLMAFLDKSAAKLFLLLFGKCRHR